MLVLLFVCLAIIAITSVLDIESDVQAYARRQRRNKAALRREMDRMRRFS
jgi:Tfp pilus assembly protein PilE